MHRYLSRLLNIIAILLILGSCSDQATTTSVEQSTDSSRSIGSQYADSLSNADSLYDTFSGTTTPNFVPSPYKMITGVAILNFDDINATFTLNERTFLLRPREAHDYEIAGNSAILKFENQQGTWVLERLKRYIIRRAFNEHWEVELASR